MTTLNGSNTIQELVEAMHKMAHIVLVIEDPCKCHGEDTPHDPEKLVHACVCEDGSRAIVICLDDVATGLADKDGNIPLEPLSTFDK